MLPAHSVRSGEAARLRAPRGFTGASVLLVATLVACNGGTEAQPQTPDASGTGAAPGSGGLGPSAGAANSGGTSGASGGGTSLGGAGPVGGSGGTAGSGGSLSGGTPPMGTGGTAGTGGTGGASPAGGAATSGGTPPDTAGGTAPTGGTVGDGGVPAAGGTTGTGASPATPPPSPDRPSTDTTWSQGLPAGPNGPIPFIVVDQFGYRPASTKIAVLRDPQQGYDADASYTPGANLAVVNQATGETVQQGAPVEWNGGATDASSGDRAWWFDFSDVTTPGTYTVVDLDNDVRSVEFDIDDAVYRAPLKHAVRMFYYQRAGFAKSAETAGADWADSASHLGPGQDSEAHAWTAKTDESLVRDLRGGWYDAGDFNKYTAWAAGTAITLLHAYREHPVAFGDDYGIAESGNGVPDLLDEIKFALDWLARMQNPDGSVLCVLGLGSASPPSQATDPSYYGPATTNATWMAAAAFAYASTIYGARPEDDLTAFASELRGRALDAWSWAEANPSVLYYNNDESRQPGSSGLASGQQEVDDAGRLFSKFQAALYLYEVTGDDAYRTFVEDNYTSIVGSGGPTEWDMEREDALVYATTLSGVSESVKSAILTQLVTNTTSSAGQLPLVTGGVDPYRAPLNTYTWGSNQIKAAQARIYQHLAAHATGDSATAAAAGAEDYVHYLHGVNPLGLVYLTHMQPAGAEHSAKTLFHTWFADKTRWDEVTDTTPGPAPGFLAGGPNPGFELDSCCTATSGDAFQCYGSSDFSLCSQSWEPPLGQPPQKAYLQFNSGWPAGSWSISEPSTGYQAKYVLVTAAYAL